LVLFSENVHEENFEKLEKWRKIILDKFFN